MADQITREEFADHMDGFEQRLGARASRSDRRLETIDSRLDGIDGRLDAIDTRLDVIDGRLRQWSERAEPAPAGVAAPASLADTTHGDEPPAVFGVMAVASALEPASANGELVAAAVEPDASPSMSASPRAAVRRANGVRVKAARGRAIVEPPTRTRPRRKP